MTQLKRWFRYLFLLISMLWHRQTIFKSKGDKLSSSAECRIRTWKSQDTYSPADWMPTHKPTELSRIKLKTWTQQLVPMTSEHSTHLTSLPVWLSHLALPIYIYLTGGLDKCMLILWQWWVIRSQRYIYKDIYIYYILYIYNHLSILWRQCSAKKWPQGRYL